jgi:hypothetical protein
MHKKAPGEAGAAKNYITRTRALKKLQLSLQDFRYLIKHSQTTKNTLTFI